MVADSRSTAGIMTPRGSVLFGWLIISLMVWSLPLVSPSSPSGPPDMSPPPFVDPLLPTQPEPIKSVAVAGVIEYLTYVLCGIAATIIAGSISAGAGHPVSAGEFLFLILQRGVACKPGVFGIALQGHACLVHISFCGPPSTQTLPPFKVGDEVVNRKHQANHPAISRES